ncbi:MAG: IS110 family transposase [Candidatus Moraniibacteriota bacterium]
MKIISIGIDVSKGKLDAGLIFENQANENLRYGNNQKGIPNLVKMLKSRQDNVEDIPIVIEATGGYHYGITFSLIEKGFKQVRVINPLITKKHLSGTVRKIKTDKKDALLLARIGLLEELKNYTETKKEILLKRKVRTYHFLKKELQRINNRLSSVKSLNLDDDFESNELQDCKEYLELKLEKVKREIIKGIKLNFPKIRGVSDFSLKAIAAEMGNVERFDNHKQVIAFAGLDPSVKESGTSIKGRSALSKRGSKTLRYYLYQSAWGVMMHNDKYRDYYQHKKNIEGKHYYTCLSAIARKLLCEIYFNLKEHSYYIK